MKTLAVFESEKALAAQEIIERFSVSPIGDHAIALLKDEGFMVMSGNPIKAFPHNWNFNTGNQRQVLEAWTWNKETQEWDKNVTPVSTLHLYYTDMSQADTSRMIKELEKGAIEIQVGDQIVTAIYPHYNMARLSALVCRAIHSHCKVMIDQKPFQL